MKLNNTKIFSFCPPKSEQYKKYSPFSLQSWTIHILPLCFKGEQYKNSSPLFQSWIIRKYSPSLSVQKYSPLFQSWTIQKIFSFSLSTKYSPLFQSWTIQKIFSFSLSTKIFSSLPKLNNTKNILLPSQHKNILLSSKDEQYKKYSPSLSVQKYSPLFQSWTIQKIFSFSLPALNKLNLHGLFPM